MKQLIHDIVALFIRKPLDSEVPEPICDICGEEMAVIYGGGEFDIFCPECDEVTGDRRQEAIAAFLKWVEVEE